MRTTKIFQKYELTENGEITNVDTGKQLKIEESASGRVTKLYVDGKTKRVNVDDLIAENFLPQSDEEKEEKPVRKPSGKNRRSKYTIKVTQLDGEVLTFNTLKAANDHYGLRKDYLNYCLDERFAHMLTKNGLQLKSVERIEKIEE